MSVDERTYTVATVRQWVSLLLAYAAVGLTTALAVVWSFQLWNAARATPVTEVDMQLYSWSYVLDGSGRVVAYAYPPILLWVALALSSAAMRLLPNSALRRPFSAEEHRRSKAERAGRKARWRAALHQFKLQLRERGHVGLLRGRVCLRLGFALVGAALIVVTSLLAPAGLATSAPAGDAKNGFLPWISLVAGGLAVVGLLLSFPYGRREKVTVDAAGNVRTIGEPAAWQPPSVPPTAGPSADTDRPAVHRRAA